MATDREILMDVLTALGIGDPAGPFVIELDGEQVPAATALGKLWSDTDFLPYSLRSWVSDFCDRQPEKISTYAVAARLLMPLVRPEEKEGPAATAIAPDQVRNPPTKEIQ